MTQNTLGRIYLCPRCGEATGAEAYIVLEDGRNKIRCATCGLDDYEKVTSLKK